MRVFEKLSREGVLRAESRPEAAKVTAGDPVHSAWNIEERGPLYCGFWHSTPGAWRVAYDEWEYVHIREGHSVLTAESGEVLELKAGDSAILRPGFRGIWEVREATLKEYVILLNPASPLL